MNKKIVVIVISFLIMFLGIYIFYKYVMYKEKEEYERNKNAFYADPIHWNNNKRRRYGLSVLRGSVNKYRSKKYPVFYPSVKFFGLLEDIITETLEDNFNNEYFNFFVEVKDLAVGDANVFRISEWENSNKEAFL